MTVRRLLLSSVAALGVALSAAGASAQDAGEAADPRESLSAGLHDAGQAAKGLTLEHSVAPPPGFFDPEAIWAPAPPAPPGTPPPPPPAPNATPPRFSPLALANTDMAVSGGKLFMGNFNGFNIYQLGEGAPELVTSVVCPGGQGDLSVHGNLLFMSVEQNRGRLDCGTSGAEGDVNAERFRGVRVFDISDITAPRQIAAVQTCRGSHTHTLVPDPRDRNVLYIYNSGTAGVRKSDELNVCSDGQPADNPETALYSIDVIKVPLDHPEQAAIVNRPRIFADRETGQINGLWTGGKLGVAGQDGAQTNQCHDITVYPELNLAAGACAGNGILLDISDPQNPARVSELFDPDMAYWHSATFSNDGSKVLFTDEWGGGIGARCRAEDPATWGADLVATIENNTLKGQGFFKLPGHQSADQNCVAHNGSLIPVPGRDLMVQAWYQGGISVVDFTDPQKPFEVAWFDRGPIEAGKLRVGGDWSAYWFNGRIYASEIARGLDVLKLEPGELLSAAEIAAASTVTAEVINPQTQTRAVWTDSPDVAQAYVDQLSRTPGFDAALATRAGEAVAGWRAGAPDKAGAAALSQTLTTAAAVEGVAAPTKARLTALAGVFERLGA